MKTIISILAIVALTLASCKKNNIEPEIKKELPIYIGFAGTYQSTFHCYINNVEKEMITIYQVKKGDVCTIVDNGNDYYVMGTPGLNPIGHSGGGNTGTQGYWVQGFTGGKILLTIDGITTTVKEYQGNGDTNLTFIVQ